MHEIGQLLKKTREDNNYTIDEVSALLNIRPKYLLAIENFDKGELPPNVYVVGYIKIYTEFLNLAIDLKKISFDDNPNLSTEKEPVYHDYKPSNKILAISLSLFICFYFSWNNLFLNKPTSINSNKFNGLKEIHTANTSNIKKFHNKDQLAFLATKDCDLKIFNANGELFYNKKLNIGEIYFLSKKIDFTMAVSHNDDIEIFNKKDLKI